jgi:type I restriction enzyme R subunit
MASGDWQVGTASGYDHATALYTEDLLGYVQDAWPKRWEKFCKINPRASKQVFLQKVVRELERAGTLDVLRHGFKVAGVAFDLCS